MKTVLRSCRFKTPVGPGMSSWNALSPRGYGCTYDDVARFVTLKPVADGDTLQVPLENVSELCLTMQNKST